MSLLHIAGGATEDKLYVEDVFSTYLYTGNGSTQTINNGIDLAGKGGLTWIKGRTDTEYHHFVDTLRGGTKYLQTGSTAAQLTDTATTFNSNGFTLPGNVGPINSNTTSFASWTFRKAPKFFDVVTYTGNGVAGRQIPHSLGCQAGMVIVKRTDGVMNWAVGHIGIGTNQLWLNTTDSQQAGQFQAPGLTSTTFTVTTGAAVNTNGATYVAYLFAHDTSADGIIQCGSFTGNGSTSGPEINLGWEPQWLLIKRANAAGDWNTFDAMRGFTASGSCAKLAPNSSAAELTYTRIRPTATGFQPVDADGNVNASGGTYIYIAIRRPMKTPTSGTQVFAIDTIHTTFPAFVSNFVVDLAIKKYRPSDNTNFVPRLTAPYYCNANSTAAELSEPAFKFDYNTGWYSGGYANDTGNISWMFKRAKGFFDVVCYTGTGSVKTVNHNLGVVPELMIVKGRDQNLSWYVYNKIGTATKRLLLNMSSVYATDVNPWNNTEPTSTVFTVGTDLTSPSSSTWIAYLFATLAGISKVGSYTGNGSSQTINCGFSTGARFVLIKRTDSTGDWYIWDTARGIVAANDPHLSLNTSAAEVTTDDSIDPDASGFIVNQNTATNINVNGASYIFLSIS